MKSIALGLMIFASSTAFAANPGPEQDYIELCVTSGECAIPVQAKEIEGTVYLVRAEHYDALSRLWINGKFFITQSQDYEEIRTGRDQFVLPAVNPSEAMMMERAGKAPTTTPVAGGPLVTGTINVNISGGSQCSDCHTGSWKQIHAGVMKPKKDDGK